MMELEDRTMLPLITKLFAVAYGPALVDMSQRIDAMERYANSGNHAKAMETAHYLIVNHHEMLEMCPQRTQVYDTFKAAVDVLRHGRFGSIKSAYYGLDGLCADVERLAQQSSRT